jgi:16S rRNA (guanine966-N2)-methyltransferase
MGKIRIIGGIHRSRQLTVLDANGLRPTLDRVKETLFNWLGQDLTGLNCLDAFSGSGSLGFEAISRNAKSVIMIELEQRVYQQLVTNQKLLNVNNCQIIHGNATEFLKTTNLVFDVIFLDPPYNTIST